MRGQLHRDGRRPAKRELKQMGSLNAMVVRRSLALLALVAATPLAAQDESADNAEMTAIFAADQAPRQGGPVDWEAVNAADAERRARVRAMIERGELGTARDFYHAAYVFQHGAMADDQLFAHVLAVRALAMGMKEAEEIAAATLDRYLQNSGRGQIYGSQVRYSTDTGVSMEPFDRELIPDALRRAMGAPTIAELEADMGEMEERLKRMLPEQANP